jgi:CDP-diacylglycerol--serine O-phosphatidyltransferase
MGQLPEREGTREGGRSIGFRLLLPNIFTGLSIFFGVVAIYHAYKGEFENGFYWVLLSGIADGIDGRVARWTGGTSRFGTEFDSLADIVAFGVAPALFYFFQIGAGLHRVGVVITALFIIFGAVRLARFNITSGDPRFFIGLPIPTAGILLSGLVTLDHIYEWGSRFWISVAVIGLGLLMVSNIRFPSFKKLEVNRTFFFKTLLFSLVVISLLYIAPISGIVLILGGYVVGGIVRAVRVYLKYRKLIARRRSAR